MKLGLALVACMAALGCDRGPDDKRCRADADALTRWLGRLNLEPQLVMVGDVRLVSRADLGSGSLAMARPIVTIGARETQYQGQLVGAAAGLAERLTATQRKLAEEVAQGRFEGRAPDVRQLYLLIDEAVPWERVVAVVEAAHRTGFTKPSFLFKPPPGPDTRPPRTAFDERMDARERDGAAGRLAAPPAPGESLFARCPPVTRLFGHLGVMETGNKVDALIRGIGPALVDCGCKVELPEVRSMLWHMLNNPSPVRGLEVELALD
ncbi:MAG TPA: hypothetical protein VNO30_03140, partial [Kofleriaceae bacterium]|nr:hypothetical protein [Kofleriaceae bacterium]